MKKLQFKSFILKKSIYLLLAIFIFTLLFAPYRSVKAASEPDTSEQANLKWIVIGNGDQPDKALVMKSVNTYLKDKINATLDLITFDWGSYSDKIKLMIAAGEPYDINFTAYWTDYNQLASISAYQDLTDMLDTYAPKTKALLGSNILKGAEVNGRIFAIPTFSSDIITNYGVLLNKSLVKKYKIDTSKIKKLQDLEPSLKKIKTKESKIIDFYPFYNNGNSSVTNTLNYDGLIYDSSYSPGAVLRDGKSTKVVNQFETADAKALFTLMNNWYKAGYISKSTTKSEDFYYKNQSKIFAMYSDISSKDLLLSENLDMIPVQLGKSSLTTKNVTVSMNAISSNSKNPERALMLLELVNTDEKLSNLLNYGIEGVHYKKTGSKTISNYPRGSQSYSPYSSWLFGNQTIAYTSTGLSSPTYESIKNLESKAEISPLLGFTFTSRPVNAEVAKINSISNKYLTDLCIGKVNPSTTLTEMNSEMKKAGLQKVITEMQKQVDEFMKIQNQ